jgi:hypothetical protein
MMAGSAPTKRAALKAVPTKRTAGAAKPRVVLDLDALTKQKAFPDLKIPTVPFTFLLNEVEYELGDPRDSDWKLALELSSNPFLLMRTALVGADDPIDDPTEDEIRVCRERWGYVSKETAEVAEFVQDGKVSGDVQANMEDPVPAVIDRFTASFLPGWKLNALFARWHEHYKIDLSAGKGILASLLGQTE